MKKTILAALGASVLFLANAAHADPAVSAAQRVEGVETIWQTAERSFPFRDRLPEFKRQVEVAKTDVAVIDGLPQYYARLERLVASLNDGHTFVVAPSGAQYLRSKPGVGIERINGVPVVSWVRSDLAADIPLGSILLGVDGVAVVEVAAGKMDRVSASTPHQALDRAASRILEGQSGSSLAIQFETPDGQKREAKLKRGNWPDGTTLSFLQPWFEQPTEFRLLADGHLAYFAARNFGDDAIYNAFASHLAEMQKARAVLIDLRHNSGGDEMIGLNMLAHFLKNPVMEGRSRVVNPEKPGELMDLPREPLEPTPEPSRINAMLFVLTDHQTISAAEDFLSFALAAGAVQLGEVTAGSTGEMVRADLPGDGKLWMVSKWDQAVSGIEFVGHGFVPTVALVPSPQALAAGHDSVLDAAVETVRTQIDAQKENPPR